MNKYSIKELSEMAGVSTATISRYLNQNGYVNAKTKRKIEAILKKTGYDPRLRKRRQSLPNPNSSRFSVGIVWNASHGYLESTTGQLMIKGASETFQRHNVDFSVDYVDDPNYLPPCMGKENLKGILFHGNTPPQEISKIISKIPVISLLQGGGLEHGGRVMPDHFHAGEIALNYFKENGVRNAYCIKGSSDSDFSASRCAGFTKAANAHGIRMDVYETEEIRDSISTRDHCIEVTKNIVEELLSLKEFPEGIFVANEYSGYVYTLLQQKGKIPMKDFLLIVNDDKEFPPFLFPEPAQLKIFPEKIGILGAEALLMKINNPDTPDFIASVPSQLLVPN